MKSLSFLLCLLCTAIGLSAQTAAPRIITAYGYTPQGYSIVVPGGTNERAFDHQHTAALGYYLTPQLVVGVGADLALFSSNYLDERPDRYAGGGFARYYVSLRKATASPDKKQLLYPYAEAGYYRGNYVQEDRTGADIFTTYTTRDAFWSSQWRAGAGVQLNPWRGLRLDLGLQANHFTENSSWRRLLRLAVEYHW